jgi:hypothetical protein
MSRCAGRLVALSLMSITLGCQAASPPDGVASPAPGFDPYPDGDGATLARVTERLPAASGAEDAGTIDVAADGTIRLVRTTLVDGLRRQVAERYSPEGALQQQQLLPAGEAIARLLPGGEPLIMNVFADHSELVRWSADFAELARFSWPYSGDEVALPDYYRIADDGSFTVEPGGGSNAGGGRRFLRDLYSDGGSGYFGVESFHTGDHPESGTRIVHLDAQLAITRATWLFPGAKQPVSWSGEVGGQLITIDYMFEGPHLLLDQQHRLWALTSVTGATGPALARFLGHPVEVHGKAQLVLLRLDGQLVIDRVVVLPAANPQQEASLAENADGNIGVTAWSSEAKPIGPNQSTNYNVAFACVDGDGRLLGQRELDLERDEQPRALTGCGHRFCIGGEMATTWVDTGSQVELSKGFVVALAADGSDERRWTLHGPRRNLVTSLAGGSDGSVVFAAGTDARITHTPEDQWYATLLLGIARF